MKQRVRVVAIVRDDARVLLLERSSGRTDGEQPSLELLIGKPVAGEQPEESVARLTHDLLGKAIKTIKLVDVVTHIDPDDSSFSTLYVIYAVTLPAHKVRLNKDRYSRFAWTTFQDIRKLRVAPVSAYILGIVQHSLHVGSQDLPENVDDHPDFAVVHTDGASRGNPGLSAAGWIIATSDGAVLSKGGEFIGITTSRQAEYVALKCGMQKALELGLKKVAFKLDNLMVVGHMNGVYKIKNRELWPIYDEIAVLLKKFEAYSFVHVKREYNCEADAEANRILDEKAQGEL